MISTSKIGKSIVFTFLLVLFLILAVMFGEQKSIKEVKHFPNLKGTEIDLLELKKGEVFETVETILKNPQKYVGCTITAMGTVTSFWQDGVKYHGIVIKDIDGSVLTLEYDLISVPGEETVYPEDGETTVVTGVWFSYERGGERFYQIKDCIIPKG